MLYLEGDTSVTWPATARILASRDYVRMVVQVYEADGPFPPPFVPPSSPQWLETVTTFGDGHAPISSQPIDVDEQLLVALSTPPVDMLDAEWDFALFLPGEREWLAASVPHESMVLVRDDSMLAVLEDAGLQFSLEAPEEW